MADNLGLDEIREFVECNIASYGMEKTKDLLVQLFANNPINHEYAKTFFKDAEDKRKKAYFVAQTITNYVKETGMIPEQDLANLRETTMESYQKLNPIYWDVVGRTMEISTSSGPAYTNSEIKKITIWNQDLTLKYWEFTPEFWKRKIKPSVHNVRTLIVERRNSTPLQKMEMDWTDLITTISPFITQLQLKWNDISDDALSAEQTLEFIKQFHKLQNFKILHNIEFGVAVDLEKFKTILWNLNRNINVAVELAQDHSITFFNCCNMRKIKWIFIIDNRFWNFLNTFRPALDANVTFEIVSFALGPGQITDYTKRFWDLRTKITELQLVLVYDNFRFWYEDSAKKSLEVLSPFVTDLSIVFGRREWNLVDEDWSWPKLKTLALRYTKNSKQINPLVITNKSPMLEKLSLRGTYQDILIFNDPKKSEEQSIVDFFGQLTQLKHLKLEKGLVQKGNQLEHFMNEILPNLFNQIEYW